MNESTEAAASPAGHLRSCGHDFCEWSRAEQAGWARPAISGI